MITNDGGGSQLESTNGGQGNGEGKDEDYSEDLQFPNRITANHSRGGKTAPALFIVHILLFDTVAYI